MQSCMQENEKKNMKNGTVEAKLAWVLVILLTHYWHGLLKCLHQDPVAAVVQNDIKGMKALRFCSPFTVGVSLYSFNTETKRI